MISMSVTMEAGMFIKTRLCSSIAAKLMGVASVRCGTRDHKSQTASEESIRRKALDKNMQGGVRPLQTRGVTRLQISDILSVRG
jgi:hypothetical protein